MTETLGMKVSIDNIVAGSDKKSELFTCSNHDHRTRGHTIAQCSEVPIACIRLPSHLPASRPLQPRNRLKPHTCCCTHKATSIFTPPWPHLFAKLPCCSRTEPHQIRQPDLAPLPPRPQFLDAGCNQLPAAPCRRHHHETPVPPACPAATSSGRGRCHCGGLGEWTRGHPAACLGFVPRSPQSERYGTEGTFRIDFVY